MCIRDRLGTLPVGIYLYQTGVLDPAQVTLCLMMALGIVSPLMRATAFINSMKSMQFAVKDTRELLDLPQLSQAKQEADLDGSGIRFRNVAFSYGGTGGAEVLHDLELHIPQGSFTALVGPSGGGKSTIARLAARFWDVTAGSITLGGRDIREMPLKQLSQAIKMCIRDSLCECEDSGTGRAQTGTCEADSRVDGGSHQPGTGQSDFRLPRHMGQCIL